MSIEASTPSARVPVSLVIRFMIFGAIVAFYLYYLGGCLLGRILPRRLGPVAELEGEAESETRFVRVFWGEFEPGVKLLFEIGGRTLASSCGFSDRQWNRAFGLDQETYRYCFLHFIHFGESEPVELANEDGLVEIVMESDRQERSRSVTGLIDPKRLTPAVDVQMRSLCPSGNFTIGPGRRFRLLVAFASEGLAGESVKEVRIHWEGRSISLLDRTAEDVELARFVMNPEEQLPTAWGVEHP